MIARAWTTRAASSPAASASRRSTRPPPASSSRGRAPEAEALRAALDRAGSDLPHARAIRARRADARAVRRFLEAERGRADGRLVCGGARTSRSWIVVVASRGGALVPRAPSGGASGFDVVLGEGFAEAHLVSRDAQGELARWPIDEVVRSGGFRLPDEVSRPALLQLVATGPSGPRPVAQRWVGEVSPHAPEVAASDAETPTLTAHITALRASHDAGALRENRLLTAEARAHAERVAASGVVRHTGVPGGEGDPSARLAARSVEARVVGEVVACGGGSRARAPRARGEPIAPHDARRWAFHGCRIRRSERRGARLRGRALRGLAALRAALTAPRGVGERSGAG